MNIDQKPGDDEDGSEFTDQQSNMSEDVAHGLDSSFATMDQPKMKKAKIEEETMPNVGGFVGMSGDSNTLTMGSMLYPPTFNPNFNVAFGAGPSATNCAGHPMQMGYHPGTSPGFHSMGHANYYMYGYPSFAMANHHLTNNGGGVGHTPGAHSNNGHEIHGGQQISGMTPLAFAAMPANIPFARGLPGQEGNNFHHPAVLQVVSADSLMENSSRPAQVSVVQYGNAASLQQPKKWVRWSDHEDQMLSRAVDQWGENNFRYISEQIFHGTRTEVQCKNRWKKALQPGLVKGRWTQEEDDIIIECVKAGNEKWSDIARRLPGRIGEQIKEHWMNVLDPDVKKGVWTEAEMKILRDSQKELGNKWSDIAKRIPGRSENSVKNRWYNQKTSDRRAQKKRELATPEQSESEQNAIELQQHIAEEMNDQQSEQNGVEERESDDDLQFL
ncbi:hypothetical protein ACHAXH_007167 [Discostella pseudostelligera]